MVLPTSGPDFRSPASAPAASITPQSAEPSQIARLMNRVSSGMKYQNHSGCLTKYCYQVFTRAGRVGGLFLLPVATRRLALSNNYESGFFRGEAMPGAKN